MSGSLFNFPAQITSGNVVPVASGTITFYLSGTLTKTTVYSDAALTTPAANPVGIDSSGRPDVWPLYTNPAISLRVIIRDALGATISGGDLDGYQGPTSLTNDTSALDAAVTAAQTAETNVTNAAATFTGTTVPDAVTSVTDEGTTQVGLVEDAGTDALAAIADDVAAAETAQALAEAARDGAELNAIAAMADVAYDTKALADADIGSRTNGDVGLIYADEDYGDIPTVRVLTAGVWAFKVSLKNIARVADLAALTAIPSAALQDGQQIVVTDQVASRFIYAAASTAKTDFGVTFVPDDLTTAFSLVSVQDTGYYPSGSLGVTDLVAGSISITYNDAADTYPDTWLHGHMHLPRGYVEGVVRDDPMLDHKTGTLFDHSQKFRQSIVTSDDRFDMSGMRATGPGRWQRVIDGPITPRMFGALEGDSTFNSRDAICWMLNYAHENGLKEVLIDGLYYFRGPIEIYEGLTVRGQGMFGDTGFKHLGDQGGGSGGVVDYLKTEYLSDTTTDPRHALSHTVTEIVQHDGAAGSDKSLAFENLQIDGNYVNNMYFLTANGGGPGAGWDDVAISGTTSQNLRESPQCSNLSMSNQSGRTVVSGLEGLNVSLHNVHSHSTLGTPYLDAAGSHTTMSGKVMLGNSVSGRVLYGGNHDNTNLEMYGFTRSSFHRPFGGNHSHIRLKNVAVNPWAANAESEPTPLAVSGLNQANHRFYSPGYENRYDDRQTVYENFTFNYETVEPGEILRITGEGKHIKTGKIETPETSTQSPVLFHYISNSTDGGITNTRFKDITLLNRGRHAAQFLTIVLNGYFQDLVIEDVACIDSYVDVGGTMVKKTDPNNGHASPGVLIGDLMLLNMREFTATLPPHVAEQNLVLRNIHWDSPWNYIRAYGMNAANATPLKIRMEGCKFDNRKTGFLVDEATAGPARDGAPAAIYRDDTSSSPITLEIINTELNMLDPNDNSAGDWQPVWRHLTRVIMVNCRTPSGRTSECDYVHREEVNTGDPAVDGPGAYLDIPVASHGLMWEPLVVHATPDNADTPAVTYVERRVAPSSGLGAKDDPTNTTLRVHLAATVADATVLAIHIKAAVAPPRRLGPQS